MTPPISLLPINITISADKLPTGLLGSADINLVFEKGLITLLGANGSGKTSVLRALRDNLRHTHGIEKVRFLSAGRTSSIENFRSNIDGRGANNPDSVAVGNQDAIQHRKKAESITGDFLALEERSDIRLKVEARLQGIFDKTLVLKWTQNGLNVHFRSIASGSKSYGAASEASGLTQLAALLAALYDDEIKFLIIDEPEVSLHPQLQSFLLKEIENVAGDPAVAGKKLVVISTHSPSMLTLKAIEDIKSLVFFPDKLQSPIQILTGNPLLIDPNLVSLIVRLNEMYKIALFSKSVLISEGVSDALILASLMGRYDSNFIQNGGQLISVSGKGELITATKFFLLSGKKVSVLGDLDVLDDNTLVQFADTKHPGMAIGAYTSFSALYTHCDTLLTARVTANWADINGHAVTKSYYKAGLVHEKRAALQFLLNASPAILAGVPNAPQWESIRDEFVMLLDSLDSIGFVLIRRGSIEDCYLSPHTGRSKPVAASQEAVDIKTAVLADISTEYSDVIKAIDKIKQLPKVDEAMLLRQQLGGLLGKIWATFNASTNDADIQTILENSGDGLSKIFQITIDTAGTSPRLRIEFVSPLFTNYSSPFFHEQGQSTHILQTLLHAV